MKCKMIEEARATGRGNMFVLEILKAIVLFAVVTLIVQVASSLIIILAGGLHNEVISTAGFLWGQIFGIALMILYCRFLEKRPVSSVGFIKNGFWKQYLKGLGVGFGMFAAVVIIGTALGAFRFVGFNKSVNFGVLLLFLGGFMIQGMYEEVFCRGYMMVSIARKSSVIVAIVINSLAFALMHAANNGFSLLAFINLMLFAIFVSLYTIKTDNIWAVGALHSIWNFSQGCIYGLSVSGMEVLPTLFVFESTDNLLANGGAFGPEGGYVVTCVLIVEIAALLIPALKKK